MFFKYIFLFLCYFLIADFALATTSSLKYINVIVDDSLYYPVTEFIDNFIKDSSLIINTRFVNDDFYRKLVYDNRVNIFITKNVNKQYIENSFTIKSNRSIGQTNYCICGARNFALKIKNSDLALKDLKGTNNNYRIALGNSQSSFTLENISNLYFTEKFSSAMDALKSLYLNKNDLGLFLYPMCNTEQGLSVLHSMDIADEIMNNIKTMKVEYRIFVVNYLNNNVESFLSFIANSTKIDDILKKYGINRKMKQFHNK
jgi:hypothetical protein